MYTSDGGAGSPNGNLVDQLRGQLVSNAAAFGVELDEQLLVYGASGKGEAAFLPVMHLDGTTADQLMSGVTLGLVQISRSDEAGPERDGGLMAGVYALHATMDADGAQGVSQLQDASGTVVGTALVQLLFSREGNEPARAELASDVSVEVGGVTVSVGWLHVCFDWNDPPGTPGGICHHTCYGW